MAKTTSLLPPAAPGGDNRKRVVPVRLHPDHYQRLNHIASYRNTKIPVLIAHLITTVLPQMEKEMEEELAASISYE